MKPEEKQAILDEVKRKIGYVDEYEEPYMNPAKVGFELYWMDQRQAVWSRKTFGPDGNPTGVLKHLKKEVDEILENPKDLIEYADALILLLDAIRRAGFVFPEVLYAAIEKQKINEKRERLKPVPGEPCEHIRGENET